MSEKGYIADDLKILEGLEAVRMRPGMYIGSTGIRGLHHILWEIVDNSVDEAANGYADEITVKLHADGSASVEDNGRGMPTDVNTKAKMSGVEVIFTKLHAGGKFDNENYAFSGGLHGVGAERGIVGIKGHRSVGGFRASLYNALPLESVKVLVDAMHDFESIH